MARRKLVIESHQSTTEPDVRPTSPTERDFERQRLTLFSRYGFDGESRWVQDRAGRPTYMVVRGEGPNPVLLVHGGYSQASEWALIAQHLRNPVVVPDRPGHGLSYAVDHRRIDFKRAASEWLLDLVNGIGADQVDLVGNSLGGSFSILFAADHPERVRRLVLVGAPGGLDRNGAPLLLRMMGLPGVGRLLTGLEVKDAEGLRKMIGRLLLTEPNGVPTDFLEVMVAADRLPDASRNAYSLFRAVTTIRGVRRSLLINDEAAKVESPTLFVWGEDDVFSPPSVGEATVAAMPDARMVKLPNAGHVPYIDHPERVAGVVGEFLA
jgi:pimeloyl-ACP methyl ester carboxylesterase